VTRVEFDVSLILPCETFHTELLVSQRSASRIMGLTGLDIDLRSSYYVPYYRLNLCAVDIWDSYNQDLMIGKYATGTAVGERCSRVQVTL